MYMVNISGVYIVIDVIVYSFPDKVQSEGKNWSTKNLQRENDRLTLSYKVSYVYKKDRYNKPGKTKEKTKEKWQSRKKGMHQNSPV
jgi:hypothetical protein